jgi:hypothetical protein
MDPEQAAAVERARDYRAQADAFRRLAVTEPLEQKRRLLALSASKYDEVAESEERIAYDRQRDRLRRQRGPGNAHETGGVTWAERARNERL